MYFLFPLLSFFIVNGSIFRIPYKAEDILHGYNLSQNKVSSIRGPYKCRVDFWAIVYQRNSPLVHAKRTSKLYNYLFQTITHCPRASAGSNHVTNNLLYSPPPSVRSPPPFSSPSRQRNRAGINISRWCSNGSPCRTHEIEKYFIEKVSSSRWPLCSRRIPRNTSAGSCVRCPVCR